MQLIDATAMWVPMRKSIGDKRRMLSADNIKTIVDLYSEFEDADAALSKVLTTEEFGYSTITVEQPLRQVFSVDDDRVEAATLLKPMRSLDKTVRQGLRRALSTLDQGMTWKSRESFDRALDAALLNHGVQMAAANRRSLASAFAESSPDGDLVTDRKGNALPDPALRDTENVPLIEDIEEYFVREVAPWEPGSWVDDLRTKVGYEIPFPKMFYVYQPPRFMADIDKDVRAAIESAQKLFSEVSA